MFNRLLEHDPIDWNQIDRSIMRYFGNLEHRTLIKPSSFDPTLR